ncbi:MAG: TFIIB-type zinc ribbon-containing protein [Candidatus Zipacnadales bacterium]
MRCPACAKEIERYEYAYCSKIMLDLCPDCDGIWVDDGELERIGQHLRAGDGEACVNADRATPYIAEVVVQLRKRALCATAGMLARRLTFP